MSEHDRHEMQELWNAEEGILSTLHGLRALALDLAAEVRGYINLNDQLGRVVAKPTLETHDDPTDHYYAAIGMINAMKAQFMGILVSAEILTEHPILNPNSEAGDAGGSRVTVSEADVHVVSERGRIVRPTIVTVSDARTGLIQSATVQEAHDGKE
ncbi:MAG: hypothetical protein DI589_26160 [Shinella sp.]|jgi:hypothetical protein|nr:MAG: hypothetical protein DI589_26160 [Shinella sp.]